jgi:alkanesulfonate monooxygenase SsuD/methylene tetrahydromethanopterin reductase-like flavin-dependent oxidoreductase (luciferase family)
MEDGRGYGTVGSLPVEALARIGAEVERLGYTNYWMNLVVGASQPLRMLEAVLDSTSSIEVGLGVIPADTYPPDELALALRTRDWPWGRLIIGVGSGLRSPGAAAFLEESVSTLRRLGPPVRIAVGGYGPRMLRAAGRAADVLCFAWMTPEHLAWAMTQVEQGMREAGRAGRLPCYLYIRSAVGPDAGVRIEHEMAIYGRQPHHVRHHAAMQAVGPVGIALPSPAARDSVPELLRAYPGTIPVIRGLPRDADDAQEWLELARCFAPRPGAPVMRR